MSNTKIVLAVCRNEGYAFTKPAVDRIQLDAGLGVVGDAHYGKTVKHRSRVAKDPSQPNIRQVHLIHAELLEALKEAGFKVFPGSMGENITTQGVDLLNLATGAKTVSSFAKRALWAS